jgi:hypothetical protein
MPRREISIPSPPDGTVLRFLYSKAAAGAYPYFPEVDLIAPNW